MQPHERIGSAIAKANEQGRTGLVPFITAGYPDPDKFIETFSDPMADGMTIQRSSFVAI
jgi:tryptophan synthase alpha subunit